MGLSFPSKRIKDSGVNIDKVLLKFFVDVLYIKEVIGIEEYEDILDCRCGDDLECVFENMMMDVYKAYGRGDMEWETQTGEIMNY